MAPETEVQERVAVVAVTDVTERVGEEGTDVGGAAVITDTGLDGFDGPTKLTAVT